MAKQRMLTFALILATLATLAGCTLPAPASTPTPQAGEANTPILPHPTFFPTSTLAPAIPSATLMPAPIVTVTGRVESAPPVTGALVTCPPIASVSGSKGVVLVQPGDVLNVRSGPDPRNPILGTYAYNDVMISVTGATFSQNGENWVEVCDSSGMFGWVNERYLTEFIPSGEFCLDARVLTLLENVQAAFTNRDGDLLASLVSPKHGVDIWLWNSGNAINFDREHAHWVFESTYVHNWGTHPASGLDTFGSFQDVVLPQLQDAFVPSAQRRCNDGEISSYSNTWPAIYTNINFYQVVRPGTAGVEMDWNAWLVGVEYLNGRPYLFALIHFIWTP